MDRFNYQRIKQIQSYCCDIADFVKRFGEDYNTFMRDKAYRHAVSMCIMQIGELANKLSGDFRSATGNIMPRGMIRGMRNALAHGYGTVDESILWETAIHDIPGLSNFCSQMIDSYISSQQKSAPLDDRIKNAQERSASSCDTSYAVQNDQFPNR